jgi:hypothetical protein
MSTPPDDYLDGNAAAGELSAIFAVDITAAHGQCASCGSMKRFAEAHVYAQAPGFVARCAQCDAVLLRYVRTGERVMIEARGLSFLVFDTA